jgi:DNA helicase-2/ATP-dependent DNA helicase PcrA
MGDELLRDLDEAQRDAVTCDDSPLAILAGPGSGKTRVLTRRIAWRIATGRADASKVLAVTFTRKAAGELTSRLRALGVAGERDAHGGPSAGTLHSIALAQLRRRAVANDRSMPGLLERKARLLVPIVANGGRRGPDTVSTAADVASEIEWAKARLIPCDQYAAAAQLLGRDPSPGVDAVATFYERYEQAKRKARLVDFDDLLWWCGDALDSDDEFAAQQRWSFRHLFVDEFQDVSPAQLRLVRGWLGERLDLTVVGDPDQAIFSFTGADPTGLTEFRRIFPGARVVRLDRNYRSTRQIVTAAEALLADGGQRRAPRVAVRPDGPAPVVTDYDTERDEAVGVARAIRAARGPDLPWSAFAVLYRINAQSAAFEAALAAEGIPYRVRGEGRFLERPAVRAVLDRLRAADKAAPGVPLASHLTDLELPDVPPEGAERERAPNEGAGDDERAQHVAAVVRLGREFDAIDPGGSVDGFVTWLSTALRNEEPAVGGDAVELLTFHRAKGLEFHTVHVTGLERGLVPIARAETPAARAEERRLLYVALTRAEHSLQLSWARRRTLGTREMNRVASPWLEPIEDACAPGASVQRQERQAARTAKAELDRARDKLARDEDDDADPALLAALVEWRRQLARTAAVPAYVIFHDTTLRAIASTRPITRTALLAVAGIGPVKASRYGDAVLAIVREHTDGPALASA